MNSLSSEPYSFQMLPERPEIYIWLFEYITNAGVAESKMSSG